MAGECNVCIGDWADDGEPVHCYQTKIVKARKSHKCWECRETIPPGACYRVATYMCDGRWCEDKTCLICVEIGTGLSCDRGVWSMGMLWEEIREVVFPDMTSACLDRMQTPEAKAFFLARWRKWKGLDGELRQE